MFKHKISKLKSSAIFKTETEEGLTYYIVGCPLCMENFQARIESVPQYAQIAALGKLSLHLKIGHKDEIDDDEKSDA
jgi:hypothetical protein